MLPWSSNDNVNGLHLHGVITANGRLAIQIKREVQRPRDQGKRFIRYKIFRALRNFTYFLITISDLIENLMNLFNSFKLM